MRRLPIAPLFLVLAALAGVLAGCGRDAGPPGPSAAGASSSGGAAAAASSSAAGCPEAVAANTYVRATSAHVAGHAVEVTAIPARRVCEGPNNGHYELEPGTEQLTMAASATVVVLTTTQRGIGHETVPATDLPERLVDDEFGRIFLVRGPSSAVTSLEEQYHP
jgi:hypothetical protein